MHPLATWCSGDRMARRAALVAALLVAALLASCGGSAKDEGEGEICSESIADDFVRGDACQCGINCGTGEYGCEETTLPDCDASSLIGTCPNRVTYREVDGSPCSSPSP